MRAAYKFLAYAIPVLVAVQAAAIAFAFFGLGAWIEDGHQLTKSSMDAQPKFVGDLGFAVHSIDGQLLIPVVALALLIVSFFAKVPGASKWAAFVLLDVVLQIALAFIAFAAPVVGMLHGLNALFLAWLGWNAAHRLATAGERASQPAATPYAQSA
ncbi:MAG TPA: hypothetical protein VFL69_07355 [Marmoricola sp.]|nr:hypothetical protein [Marmoricola sp.]